MKNKILIAGDGIHKVGLSGQNIFPYFETLINNEVYILYEEVLVDRSVYNIEDEKDDFVYKSKKFLEELHHRNIVKFVNVLPYMESKDFLKIRDHFQDKFVYPVKNSYMQFLKMSLDAFGVPPAMESRLITGEIVAKKIQTCEMLLEKLESEDDKSLMDSNIENFNYFQSALSNPQYTNETSIPIMIEHFYDLISINYLASKYDCSPFLPRDLAPVYKRFCETDEIDIDKNLFYVKGFLLPETKRVFDVDEILSIRNNDAFISKMQLIDKIHDSYEKSIETQEILCETMMDYLVHFKKYNKWQLVVKYATMPIDLLLGPFSFLKSIGEHLIFKKINKNMMNKITDKFCHKVEKCGLSVGWIMEKIKSGNR
jgi:hypothetical protein